jgi:glutathione S-transferase
MPTLTHFPFCPHSRAIRLALAELGLTVELLEERPWEWTPALLALNPSGDLPILRLQNALRMSDCLTLCGSYAISEYLAATATATATAALDAAANAPATMPRTISLFPGSPAGQAEVRRLVDWFHGKLHREVTVPLLEALALPLFEGAERASPDTDVLRAARANLGYHMSYVAWLADQRNWLAGPELSFADLAAAAHLSCLDYFGEIDWGRFPPAKTWYQRLKSRRAFQPLLTDRIPGRPPATHYAELDF